VLVIIIIVIIVVVIIQIMRSHEQTLMYASNIWLQVPHV
jgi:hypothetical protein